MNEIDFQKKIYSQAIHPFFNEYLEVIKLPDFIWHYSSQYALSGIIDGPVINRAELFQTQYVVLVDELLQQYDVEVIHDFGLLRLYHN